MISIVAMIIDVKFNKRFDGVYWGAFILDSIILINIFPLVM